MLRKPYILTMQKHNIGKSRNFFSVIGTAKRTQVAMMTLAPGEASEVS